jgi:CheY-like chemotaxis protein
VLDLMLPGIDGLEVCRRIHQDRHVPVLMLTGRDGEADVRTGSARRISRGTAPAGVSPTCTAELTLEAVA